MRTPIFSVLLLFGSAFATAIPSLVHSLPSDLIDKRQSKGRCADYGAASNKPTPDALIQKPADGTCCGSPDSPQPKPFVKYTWTITEGFVTVLGECKFMHIVNDAWPPPQIVVNKGTVIRLEVINRLATDPITLHAHGLDQKNTQWMDGPESLVQRGIPPGRKFVYEYDTSKESAGTYWIHNHVAGQYPKGLRAPLIILDQNRQIEANNWKKSTSDENVWDGNMDNILSLSDWFSQDWGKWEGLYQEGKCGKGVEVPPVDFLVNDLRADKDNTQTYDFRTSKTNPKSGRVRLINMSAFTTFYVYMAPTQSSGISSMKLKVIEADGVLMDGNQVSQVVEIAPGQRLSVLVDPENWAIGEAQPNKYRMVITVNPYEWRHTQIKSKSGDANVDPKCYEGPNDVEYLKTKLPVHHIDIMMGERKDGDPQLGPAPTFYDKYRVLEDTNSKTYRACFIGVGKGDCTNDSQYPISTNFADFDDMDLKPLVPGNVQMPTDQAARYLIETWEDQSGTRRANLRVIRSDQQSDISNSQRYDFFAPQDTPAIELIRTGKRTYADFAPWKHTMIVPDNQDSYIVALYSWTGTHPIHLHGHKFRVLYRERQQTTSEVANSITLPDRLKKIFTFDMTSANPLRSLDNTAVTLKQNPLQRDTITLYKFGLVVLQIEADNPGAWFLHCHNDFHAHTGMASMVIEKPDAMKARLEEIHRLNGREVDDYRKLVNGNAFDPA
ncbi:unnamed protein product [Periconia digitata]|uniref:Laccase n=1 Tax=Periconia digitata TaxID=1303443 RepID=A0A9W4UIL7_9PLEO|nr:unnamed protein product [Periconia digitata]